MSRTGDDGGRDRLVEALLPRAIEVMTAWSVAEDGDPAAFTGAMNRVIGDVADAENPRQELARLLLAPSALTGALLDLLAEHTGASREEVLQAVHARYVGRGS